MFNHIHPDTYKTITADAISIFDKTYNEEELIFIIEHFNVSLSCLLTTQTLSDKIINTYFLRTDNKYCKNSRDEDITIDDIKRFQPHIKLKYKLNIN